MASILPTYGDKMLTNVKKTKFKCILVCQSDFRNILKSRG